MAYNAGSPSTYLEYVASDIPSSVSKVSIALVDPANVTVSSAGKVTFTRATGSPSRAELNNPRVGDLRIRAVNGGAIVPTANVASANVSNGRVTFRVAVGGNDRVGDAVPVVYVPTSGNLAVGNDGAPTTHFGVGGAITTTTSEAPAPTTASTTVWSAATDRFVGTTIPGVGHR